MIINSQNVSELSSEKFSDSLKDKFIFENKTEMEKGLDKEVIVFIQENFRFNNFKQDQKKSYLFGFNRTIREKIYSQFWSPELYIIDGLKEQIINISLKV